MDSNSAFINCALAAMRRLVCTLLLMGASAWAGWLLFGAGLRAIAIGTVIMFAITPLCMIVFFRERCWLQGGFAMVFTFAATAFALFAFVEIEFESRLAMLDVVRPAAATPWAPLENAFTEARHYASMALSALLCIGALAGPRPGRPPTDTPQYEDLLHEPEAPTHSAASPESPSCNYSCGSVASKLGAKAASKQSKSRSSGGRAGGSRSGASGVAAKTAGAADRSSARRRRAKRQNRKPAEKPRPRLHFALNSPWLRQALAIAAFLAAALMAGTAAGEDAKTHRLARDGPTAARQTGTETNWALQAISLGPRVEADFSVKLQKESLIDLFGDHLEGLSGTRSAGCASRLLA